MRGQPPRRPASRPCGRPRAGWCVTPSCPWPRSGRSPTGSSIGSGCRQHLDAQPGRAWRRPSPRSTTWRPAGSSAGSARGGTRWPARSASTRRHPLTVMREVVTVVRALLHDETVTFDGDVRAPRRRRARLRPPGATAQGRADLHRRDRHADDGAGRRDRRRRGAQLPRVARVQRARARRAWPTAPPRPGGRSTTSIGRSSSCARSTPTASAALDARPAPRHAVPGAAAAHHEGLGRARRRCSTRSARC